jgi:Ca-activated chloride channel family protein
LVKRLALASALLLAVSHAAVAQESATDLVQRGSESSRPQEPTVFRSGASIVALNVTVLDKSQKLVTGLRPEDFAVYEDGVQQRVDFFEATQVPVDLILLLDASSSMRDKMPAVREAALGFLRTLRPQDRGAIVSFADGVDIAQPLTADGGALEAAIRRTRAEGATSLYNALYISIKEFGRSARQSGELRRQAIAVLSDGEDTSSLISFDDVVALARKAAVNVYTIRLQSKYALGRSLADNGRRYFSEAAYSMRTLAQETGAQAFFPAAVGELKGVYATIARELSAQYSIGYSPSNGRRDGRFRRIVVRVVSDPELRPRARAGYTAESSHSSAMLQQQPR